MDTMFGASCWLLLVLSAQRSSPAPIPAGVRSSGVEVPDTETLISPAVTSEEALKNTGSVDDVRINSSESGGAESGSDAHIPAEPETVEMDQMGQAAGETAQKDEVVHVDSAGEALNPGDGEAVFIRLSQIKEEKNVSKVLEEVDASETSLVDREEQETKDGNTEKHAEEAAAALDPIMLDDPAPGGTEKEDNLVFGSAEFETEEDQTGPDADDTTPDKSGQEDPEAAGPVESEKEDFLLPRTSTEVEEAETFQTNIDEGVLEEETDEEDFGAAAHFVDLTNAAVSAAASRKAERILPAAAESDPRLNIQSEAPLSSVQEAPVAPVNRGAVLRAALLTLTSLIVAGFVGMTMSKKLR